MFPYLLMGAVVVGPALTLAIVAVTRAFRSNPGHEAELLSQCRNWVGVCGLCWVGSPVLSRLLYHFTVPVTALLWMGFVAYAIALSHAYRLQEGIYRSGNSVVSGRAVIWTALLLQLLCMVPAVTVPMATWLRYQLGTKPWESAETGS